MARRTRIIEGTWDCTSCGNRGILGREKVCPGCGNPREQDVESKFDFGPLTESGASTREAVTDAEALAAAAAGIDWYCAYCGSGNRGDGTVCRACSAERDQKTEPPSPSAEPEAAVTLPAPTAVRRGCLSPVAVGCTAIGGALLALLIGLGIWGGRTREAEGRVVARSWKREVARETFTRVTRTGWRDEIAERRSVMPVRGAGESSGAERIRDCSRKQRGSRKVATGTRKVCSNRTRQVKCGTEEKCHRKDLGNGFAEEVCDDVPRYCSESYEDCRDETQYRDEPVFGEECHFDTWEWRSTRGAVAQGSDEAPSWPDLAPESLDREHRTEAYEVVVAYGPKATRHTIQAKSAEEFARFPSGAPVSVVVNNFGSVVEARPASR